MEDAAGDGIDELSEESSVCNVIGGSVGARSAS